MVRGGLLKSAKHNNTQHVRTLQEHTTTHSSDSSANTPPPFVPRIGRPDRRRQRAQAEYPQSPRTTARPTLHRENPAGTRFPRGPFEEREGKRPSHGTAAAGNTKQQRGWGAGEQENVINAYNTSTRCRQCKQCAALCGMVHILSCPILLCPRNKRPF